MSWACFFCNWGLAAPIDQLLLYDHRKTVFGVWDMASLRFCNFLSNNIRFSHDGTHMYEVNICRLWFISVVMDVIMGRAIFSSQYGN